MTTKILFLDFDGVLNHSKWLTENAGAIDEARTLTGLASIDPECVKRVDQVCLRTGAVIVISSSWRIGNEIEYLRKVLRQSGLTADVVDMTPYGPGSVTSSHGIDADGKLVELKDEIVRKFRETGDMSVLERLSRGHEIQRWMDSSGYTNVDHIAILDDDADMAHLLPRLVKTEDGIEDHHIERAVELLGEKR